MLSSVFQNAFGRPSLVSPEDTWSLLFVLVVSVALSIYLEQKYTWASKISGAILALIIALVLSNLGIIPTHSVLYDDIIWGYAVPLGIPLLLLQVNMKKIWKETGKLMGIFLIGACGTVVGAIAAYNLFGGAVPEPAKVAAIMTGSYIGGGVNFAALAAQFNAAGDTIGATTVADNLLMAIYFFVLIFIGGTRLFRKHFRHPHIEEVAQEGTGSAQTQAAAYWKRKDISLKDVAVNLAVSVTVVFLSNLISGALTRGIPTDSAVFQMINLFLGSQYVWITTLALLFTTFFEKQVEQINGSQEIGTYFIYLFLFVIGVPASIMEIITKTPALFLFTGTMVLVNMIFTFVGGKLLKFDLEECIISSNANIGGPTTAAGMAISQGWTRLVGPAMLVGTFGYVIGTYAGVLIGGLLGA